jgi:hypothetical protein
MTDRTVKVIRTNGGYKLGPYVHQNVDLTALMIHLAKLEGGNGSRVSMGVLRRWAKRYGVKVVVKEAKA